MAVSLMLKTGKGELLRKETERSPLCILHHTIEISLAHIDKKQSVVIISYCKSLPIVVWCNYDILSSDFSVNEGRKQQKMISSC